MALPPSPLPHPPVTLSGRPLPVDPRRWLPFVEGVRVCLCLVRSLYPLPPHASVSSLLLCARAASSVSLSPSPMCVLPASSAALPVGSGARRWHNTPDIISTCRCEWPCSTFIARSCMSTWARIRSRRRQQYKPILMVPWCEPPAPSPPSSLLSPPRS